MLKKILILLWTLALTSAVLAASTTSSSQGLDAATTGTPAATKSSNDAAERRIEGERRFHENCGRCHAAPHKFPPRMMATIVRHMRVRAMITDEDMHLILDYMTQ
jgi:cytochrome c5